MKTPVVLTGLSLLTNVLAQQAGTEETETHPKLTWSRCSGSGSCSSVSAEIVIDANWRWAHDVGGYENCFDGNEWTDVCSGAEGCAKNCAIEGANYQETYGITTSGDELRLQFVTEHEFGTNIGSRTYLMESATKYQMFTLMDNEFAFDVDLSTVECGMNSALYFVPMKPDGGLSDEPNNGAGAKFGTGYCDAQCARDLKFINGKANVEGWEPSDTDENSGVGGMGSCCAEIDIWESNSHSFAFTPHTCEEGWNEYHVCGLDFECGGTYSDDRFAGKCDANGCDYNPFRLGNQEFYGQGSEFEIDTTQEFTVISRFEVDSAYQIFIQDGNVIQTPPPTLEGLTQFDAVIAPDFCEAYPIIFEDFDRHNDVGGHPALNQALTLPMVLVMSIWADHYASMLWLDSLYPPEKEGTPGALRGRCPEEGRGPDDVVANHPDAYVIWSNIRYGPIGSTYDVSGGTVPPSPGPGPGPTPPGPGPSPPSSGTAPRWGQCGGIGWSGPTQCVSGSTCQRINDWYHQCL